MQTGKSIINLPLLICIALSIAIHVMALYSHGFDVPASIELDPGKTVVQLTLLPTVASQAAEPEPPPPEPEPIPLKPVEPIPAPIPEPVAKPEPVIEPPPEPVAEPRQIAEPTPEPSPPEPIINPEAEKTAVDSVEQNSTLITEKGVSTQAVSTRPIQPQYPRISQRRNEEGNVVLAIEVKASGRPGKISVAQSSGYKRLDDAAVKAVQRATFTPARKFGRPVDSQTEITITFKLTDE